MTQNAKSIWIVDDDPDELYLTTRALRRICPEVHLQTFDDPKLALEQYKISKLNGTNPGLFVSDFNMPQMSGVDLLQQVQGLCNGTRSCGTIFVLCSSAPPAMSESLYERLPCLGKIITKDLPQDFAGELLKLLDK